MQDHVLALKKSGLKPIAIASSNLHSSSQVEFTIKNNIPKNYQNWKKLLDQETYDGIVIATRIESTVEILEDVIKQNVPILVEKPVSINSNEIKKLIKKSHELIMVGFNRRFYKTVNTIKNTIHTENKPVIANMIIPESNIKNFFINSSHGIDILHYIFGDIKLQYTKKLIQNKTMKGFVATFSNEKNDLIQLIGSWNSSDNVSLSVFCDTKKMELKPYETLKIYDGLQVVEPTKNNPIRKYIPSLVNEIGLDSIDKKIKPGFFQQSTIFSEFVKTNKRNINAATLFDALKTIEICEKLVGKYPN
jgi:predicted dehydrogenase